MTPLVSVVIPNYNNGRFLAQAIDSALGQTYTRIEIIVVDDGSTDDSRSILQRYAGRVTWFEQPRRGVSAARNRGIAECHGSFIAFLDSDDYWRKDKLECQMPLFDRPEVGMVCCGVEYVDRDGRTISIDLTGRSGRTLREFALFELGVHSGSAPVIRRACLDTVGVFDEDLAVSEDWDMWRRVMSSFETAFVEQALVSYRQHPHNLHHDVDLLRINMRRALDRMFSDPLSREVWPLRQRIYGRLHLTLAGSYAHNRRWGAAIREAATAILMWPPAAIALARRVLAPGRGISMDRVWSNVARGSSGSPSREVDEAMFDPPKPEERADEDRDGDERRGAK